MAGIKKYVLCIAMLFSTANSLFAYGTINGHLQPESPPVRCAAFAYAMNHAPASPYAAPLFAAPCDANGLFSMLVPSGTYLIAVGVSLGGSLFATQADPARRLPLDGLFAQIITVTDGSTHNLSRGNATDSSQLLASRDIGRPADANLVKVKGTVRERNGSPVPLAVVMLLDPDEPQDGRNKAYLSTPTDREGNYTVEKVKGKTYLLQAIKIEDAGFLSGETPPVELSASANPSRYDITVSRFTSPKPPASAPNQSQNPATVEKPAGTPFIDPSSL